MIETLIESNSMSEPLLSNTAEHLEAWRPAQALWRATPIAGRLKVLKRARHAVAESARELASAISASRSRNVADTLVAEVLPLLDALRFLERKAQTILAPRRLGTRGLPLWLSGLQSEVHRVPYGKILVIAPGNYPLFLPGVQTVQALVAGNAVVWKPGVGGTQVAEHFAGILYAAGLPRDLLRVTEETIQAAEAELQLGADKIVFTGSAGSGKTVLHRAADSATPAVMELSGCDAVIALPSANPQRLAQALQFGMRLNGSATCMAPRRLFLVGSSSADRDSLLQRVLAEFTALPAVELSAEVHRHLSEHLMRAVSVGAVVHGKVERSLRPLLVTCVTPEMSIASADVFAPLLMVLEVKDTKELMSALERCPYALTAAIFGQEQEARAIAPELTVGTVLINDIIVPTADPRVPFGGRRQSGFGVTRGREGLLEMTALKVLSVRTSKSVRHYAATTEKHADLFSSLITATHASGWRTRVRGLKTLLRAARNLKNT